MKNTMKYFLGTLLLAGSMVACSPDEFPGMNEAGIPALSQYASAVKVDVDQSTNTVTFNLNAAGVYPVWVITEGDKEYRSSQNGYSRQFLVAGTYSYKCYIGSRDGVSKDYTEGNFTLNESRIDISKEKGFLTAAPWRIASSKPGHLGCGSSIASPTDWWSANPNDKADWGVYDCYLDFSEDGTYTLDPGESGVIYVNKDVTVNGWGSYYLGDDQDYNVPVAGTQQSHWSIEIDGTDLWLVLGENPYFPYIANNDVWQTPRYKIVSISAKTMNLVIWNGGIAWNYILTTEAEASADPKDILAGTWRIDNTAAGHLGCGPDMGNPGGWWSAGANEKADWGVYDCVLTFDADGNYTMDPGPSGVIYVNKDVTVNGWDQYFLHDDQDYNVPVDGVQKSTWTLSDEVINLGENPYFPYIANNDVWNNPEYHILNMTEDHMTLAIFNGGIAWQYILVKDVQTPEKILTSTAWQIAGSVQGHLGCGPNMDEAGGWWSAAPYDKADWGVYDCLVTFGADGTYTMDPGESGVIYVNKDVTVNGWDQYFLHDDQDYNVPVDGVQASTWSLVEGDEDMVLNLGSNPYFPYIANNDVWNNPEYHIQAISANQVKLVIWNGGIAWQYILEPAN